jgi:hypothetical protein
MRRGREVPEHDAQLRRTMTDDVISMKDEA